MVADNAITLSANTTFQIDDGGTYYHYHNTNLNIFNGTESFAATSTIKYSMAGAQTVADIDYGGILTLVQMSPYYHTDSFVLPIGFQLLLLPFGEEVKK